MWHEEINSARLKKRSLTLAGHKTSVSLEEPFWALLKAQALSQGKTLTSLILEIDSTRKGSLSSALRLYILEKSREE